MQQLCRVQLDGPELSSLAGEEDTTNWAVADGRPSGAVLPRFFLLVDRFPERNWSSPVSVPGPACIMPYYAMPLVAVVVVS